MAKSDIFKTQHKSALDLVGKINQLAPQHTTKGVELRTLLAQLAGGLTSHLKMEDDVLYKKLLSSPEYKSLAERFQKEMGGIATAFVSFVTKYNTPTAIQGSSTFQQEWNGIVKALGSRIQKEESDLYTAFDKI